MTASIPEQIPSLWNDGEPVPTFPALESDIGVDVCVIGAGIAGLSTAYLLAVEGQRVIVIDARGLAAGQTGRTSAHLSSVLDDRLSVLESIRGRECAFLAADSHARAIDLIEDTVAREGIDCDFRRVSGWLFAADECGVALLEEEFEAACRADLTAQRREGLPIATLSQVPAIRFDRQAQFHPLRYMTGLASAFKRHGGRIYGDTAAASVCGGPAASVRTTRYLRIEAASIVVATNTPINNTAVIHTKQAPYTTYVVAFAMPQGEVPCGLYWDTADPYHYVRVHQRADGTDVLITGGEDHKTGQAADPEARWANLERWTRRYFMNVGFVIGRWSGQVIETLDGLAYIGRNPSDHDNVYVATGDSGMGLTHGTLAGMIISELISHRSNPWAGLYDPARMPFRALGTFVKENLNVVTRLADWLHPEALRSAEEIPLESGAVIQHGLGKHAVYRGASGELHVCSAVCPHLGCIVRWNSAEKIWSCPCHGSRFDRYGRLMTGPARQGLSEVRCGEFDRAA